VIRFPPEFHRGDRPIMRFLSAGTWR
jgi:hypothetical protein